MENQNEGKTCSLGMSAVYIVGTDGLDFFLEDRAWFLIMPPISNLRWRDSLKREPKNRCDGKKTKAVIHEESTDG